MLLKSEIHSTRIQNVNTFVMEGLMKSRKGILFLFFLLLLVLPTAVFSGDQSVTKELAENNNTFAISLYKQLNSEEGNLFFSPHSISTAMAMLYAGASGQTQTQMAEAFCFTMPQKQLHPAFRTLNDSLTNDADKEKNTLYIANRLWPQKGFSLLPSYLTCTKKF